ncbi:spore-associated protein A [Streptomyces sp. S.PB5]|uniref:spore-associated protein A n=1 Tax=Streptomyces sp. S.PB5 TaxID=3020844 RepID=UPI0025B01F26|nr:spore-associated protein A [Streptomyces sp. S.PB5]MDN3023010.1 spore-associated protein A [Streptomyces sp. S.PB5]
MLHTKRLGTVAAVIGLTAAGTIAATGTASAATYTGTCGSGYSVIDTMDVGDGTAFLTYSGSSGKNCVVTVSDTQGTPMVLGANLRLHRTDTVWKAGVEEDSGTFKYYAGPLYVSAAGKCIDWGGRAASNYTRIDYGVHCG